MRWIMREVRFYGGGYCVALVGGGRVVGGVLFR